VRTRQPLGRALVGAPGWTALPAELRAQIADELNVSEFEDLASIGGDLVEYAVKPNFRELGKRYGKDTPKVAKAVTAADPAELVRALRSAGTVALDVAEVGEVSLGAGDVIVTERPRSGWAVESAAGETLALDLEVTAELRRAGLVREVVRLVQEARKTSGLDVTDRIELWWEAGSAELAEALRDGGALLAAEVLAVGLHEGPAPEGLTRHHDQELGFAFRLRRAG
jgi:isoleucyl-tRNA synthetase